MGLAGICHNAKNVESNPARGRLHYRSPKTGRDFA